MKRQGKVDDQTCKDLPKRDDDTKLSSYVKKFNLVIKFSHGITLVDENRLSFNGATLTWSFFFLILIRDIETILGQRILEF